jgi:hypothetical protein
VIMVIFSPRPFISRKRGTVTLSGVLTDLNLGDETKAWCP